MVIDEAWYKQKREREKEKEKNKEAFAHLEKKNTVKDRNQSFQIIKMKNKKNRLSHEITEVDAFGSWAKLLLMFMSTLSSG